MATNTLHGLGLVPQFHGVERGHRPRLQPAPAAGQFVPWGTTLTAYMKATANPLSHHGTSGASWGHAPRRCLRDLYIQRMHNQSLRETLRTKGRRFQRLRDGPGWTRTSDLGLKGLQIEWF
jgi:hypothetical protein